MSEFNEFKPRLKSPKNRFQMSVGLNNNFKCNQPYLSRGLNLGRRSNSASGCTQRLSFIAMKTLYEDLEFSFSYLPTLERIQPYYTTLG